MPRIRLIVHITFHKSYDLVGLNLFDPDCSKLAFEIGLIGIALPKMVGPDRHPT